MNELVDQYFSALKDKKTAVLGIGVSNQPLLRMLLMHRIAVTACDKRSPEELHDEVMDYLFFGAKVQLGKHYLDGLDADVIFRTPGIRPDVPQIAEAVKNGAVLSSEMEAFFEVCPCRIIAVTGSDGKTTTTTLIAEMLRHAGHRVWVGGNIGQPLLLDAENMLPEDFAVVELSSFQLMTMKRSADVAVVTNLAPNHLDWHRDMDEYVAAKENVFLHQNENGILIVNHDNDITRSFAEKAKGRVLRFSRENAVRDGVFCRDGVIFRGDREVLRCDEIRLPGLHNVENYMAAICAVQSFVSDDDIRAVAQSFGGVEHRIELVRELDGVKYYNDSIASSPSRTIAGLRAFSQKVILIAGGYDKKIPFDTLGSEICKRVKVLVLCGDTAEKIRKSVENAEEFADCGIKILQTDTFAKAVSAARDAAEDGDIVTLSPACAAFDRFRNFEERGKVFKQLVREL